jgi:hypothetical protein
MIQPDEYSEYDWYDFHKSQGHRLIWVTEDELADLLIRKVPRTLWDRIRPNKTEPPF